MLALSVYIVIVCKRSLTILRGGNSVVECDLAKVDVVGSNPIRRSILLRRFTWKRRYGFAEIVDDWKQNVPA